MDKSKLIELLRYAWLEGRTNGLQNNGKSFSEFLESKEVKEQLNTLIINDAFIYVKDQEPPINTELVAQDPNGVNHLTTWRESYKIFMCQSKQEDSLEWKWKEI